MNVPAPFKTVFFAVFVLTILSYVGSVAVVLWNNGLLNEGQRELLSMSRFGWQAGLGAMLALLSRKAAD
jgi:hypothetical protein